ncbi:MAG TPA: GGDEF domain-containing protein [bacterium]|nr:GGDEF domain-containing protein [bacterium]
MLKPTELELRIGKLDGIPALPANVEKLITLALDEEASTAKIAELISRDPALSAKLLKTVNSPYYGFPQRIGTVIQAAVILGLFAVRNIALSISVLDRFQTRKKLKSYLPKFMEHSMTCGVAARLLSQEMNYPFPEEAFMAGLLHDIGILALFECAPDHYPRVLHAVAEEQIPLPEAELSLLGMHHARAGELLCRGWGLPNSLEVAIRNHHNPDLQWKQGDPESTFNALTRLADLAAYALSDGKEGRAVGDFCSETHRLLGQNKEEAIKLLETMEPQVQEMGKCLNIRIPNRKVDLKVILAATDALSKATLQYEQREKQMSATLKEMKGTEVQILQENERLQTLSDLDGLTGIYNHRYFQERLVEEMAQARTLSSPISLAIIDLDHFKKVNDTYGHLTGDQVLQETANLLETAARDVDVAARYGGEEFVFIMPNSDMKTAYEIISRLKGRVEKHHFQSTGPVLSVTFSAGIATLLPGETSKTPQEIIQEADQALLLAKKEGRNRVRIGTRSSTSANQGVGTSHTQNPK